MSLKTLLTWVIYLVLFAAIAIMMMLSTGCSNKRVIAMDCKDSQFENLWLCKRY